MSKNYLSLTRWDKQGELISNYLTHQQGRLQPYEAIVYLREEEPEEGRTEG